MSCSPMTRASIMTRSEQRCWDLMSFVERILPTTIAPQLSLYGSLVAPAFYVVQLRSSSGRYVSSFTLPI